MVRKNDPAIKYIENDDLLVACKWFIINYFYDFSLAVY